MHATRDTNDVMYINLAGGRVMRGVRRLVAKHESQRLAGLLLTKENSCG
jgi:hypothetical protein